MTNDFHADSRRCSRNKSA